MNKRILLISLVVICVVMGFIINHNYLEQQAEEEKKDNYIETEVIGNTIKDVRTNVTNSINKIIEDIDNRPKLVSYGRFRLTAYCGCIECSEQYGTQTATGTTCKAGRTIAVDPKVIPYGTKVLIIIDGVAHEYVAEDCGALIKGNDIDIYFDTHSETYQFGVRYANVFVIEE